MCIRDSLGESLEAARERADLLRAVLDLAARPHDLEVVHEKRVEAVPLLELERPGSHLEERGCRRIVHEELRFAHLLRREEEGLLLLLREAALAQALEVHARLGALNAEAELLGGHFEGKEADDEFLVDRQIRRDV